MYLSFYFFWKMSAANGGKLVRVSSMSANHLANTRNLLCGALYRSPHGIFSGKAFGKQYRLAYLIAAEQVILVEQIRRLHRKDDGNRRLIVGVTSPGHEQPPLEDLFRQELGSHEQSLLQAALGGHIILGAAYKRSSTAELWEALQTVLNLRSLPTKELIECLPRFENV